MGSEVIESVYDYEQAARYLNTTPRHVRRLYANRQLAAYKVGRFVRFSRDDLDRYLAAQRVEVQR